MDDWMEGSYEERYEEPDYEVWERNQIDRDRDAGEFDEYGEELPPDDEEKDYLAGSHGSDADRPEPQF
jgi:hypothetical protein